MTENILRYLLSLESNADRHWSGGERKKKFTLVVLQHFYWMKCYQIIVARTNHRWELIRRTRWVTGSKWSWRQHIPLLSRLKTRYKATPSWHLKVRECQARRHPITPSSEIKADFAVSLNSERIVEIILRCLRERSVLRAQRLSSPFGSHRESESFVTIAERDKKLTARVLFAFPFS